MITTDEQWEEAVAQIGETISALTSAYILEAECKEDLESTDTYRAFRGRAFGELLQAIGRSLIELAEQNKL